MIKMMRRSIFAVATILILILSYSSLGEHEVASIGKIKPYWVKTYGGDGDDIAKCVDAYGDVVYVAGETSSGDATKIFLLKYTSKGRFQWNVSLDGSAVKDIVVYGDAIYVLGEIDETGNKNVFVSKVSSDGNIVWTKTWGGSSEDIAGGIVAKGNAIYICGETKSFGALGSDVFIAKYDLDGNFVWQKLWGRSGNEGGYDILSTNDGVCVVGYTTSYGAGEKDVLVLKFDFDGNIVWTKTWGGSSEDIAMKITSLDEFYVLGYTASYFPHALLLKYDGQGNMLFERRWGESEEDIAEDIATSSDAIFIVGKTAQGWGGDIFLLKYTSEGILRFAKTWGGFREDAAYGIDIDGSVMYIVGYTTERATAKDAFILKCNLYGVRSISIEKTGIINNEAISVFGREVFPLLEKTDSSSTTAALSL